MMTYRIYDQTNRFVGFTTNQGEMQTFMNTHPGHTQAMQLDETITEHHSTLPTLQENPVKPQGDFLRQ